MSNSKNKKPSKPFRFIHVTNPIDTLDGKVRKQVRSHVTRWQHSHSRVKAAADAVQSSTWDGDEDVDDATRRSDRARKVVAPRVDINADERSSSFSSAQWHARRTGCQTEGSSSYSRDQPADENLDTTETTLLTPEACRLSRMDMLTQSFSRGAMSFRTLALHDAHNTIGLSLHSMHLSLSSVMGLYESICRAQAVDFALQYGISGDASSWGRFYTFVFTDPVLLSTAVLLGVRNQLDVLGRCVEGSTWAAVVGIERFLVKSISDALGEGERGVSDQLLVAVALCAAYEIKHGEGASYHVHMQGLVRVGFLIVGYFNGLKACANRIAVSLDEFIPLFHYEGHMVLNLE